MNTMNELLNEFKLSDNIPVNIRNSLYRNKRKNLIKILKRAGRYNLLFGYILYFYFTLRSIGISTSLYQSMAIALSASLLSAGVVTAGTYITVKTIKNSVKENVIIEKPINYSGKKILDLQKKELKKAEKNSTITGKPDYSKIRNKITCSPEPVSGEVDKRILSRINERIKKELLYLRGAENFILQGSSQLVDVPYVLAGSIDKFNNVYTINIKVFNGKTSKIIYGSSASFKTVSKIDKACKKITADISSNIE